jgi:hypothetical protein
LLPWFDRATGDPVTVITGDARHQPDFAEVLASGAVAVDTLGDILARYTRRPEHKSLTPMLRTPSGSSSAGRSPAGPPPCCSPERKATNSSNA